jgi:L-alanine-DL-glutamate epimerase-like enolase superfamily enzyme
MTIKRIDLTHVRVPWIAEIAPYHGVMHHGMIEVFTDDGISGIGDRYLGYDQDLISVRYSYDILRRDADALIGKDVSEIDPWRLPGGFECALFDIIGQSIGVPVWKLMGTKYRDRIPVGYWSPPMPAEKTAEASARAAEKGFTVHKLKARSYNIVETARLITEATGGKMLIRVDPNTEFKTLPTALRLARELEGYPVDCFEDPILKDNVNDMRLLREKTDILMAYHLGSAVDVLKAAKAEALDCVNLGGNALSIKAAAAVAEAQNWPCWVQMSGVGLGPQAAFSLHVQATIPNATMACDELPFTKEHDLLAEPLTPKGGHYDLPAGPGLGARLDHEAMRRYEVKG